MKLATASRTETLIHTVFAVALLALGSTSACSGGGGVSASGGAATGGGPATGGNSGTAGSGGSAADRHLGAFVLTLNAPVAASATGPAVPGSTTLVGRVSDGPTPPLTTSKQSAIAGKCQLLVPVTPFCPTPCGSSVCVADGVCQSYPKVRDLGKVVLEGVSCGSTTSVELSNTKGTYQLAASPPCSYPGFAEGGELSLETSAGDVPAFALTTRGIAPLTVTSKDLPLVAGQALVLAWTPPADTQASRIQAKMDISHHGGSRGAIVCDTEDTGSLTISGDLVSKLLALGIAGFPSVIVTRTAAGSTALADGRVDFTVSSAVDQPVQIAGLVSCTGDEDCAAAGKTTCQDDRTCK